MPDLFLLTEAEIATLQGALNKIHDQRQNTSGRPSVHTEQSQSPDVYIALSPPLGIPCLYSGPGGADRPGHAVCNIYRILSSSGTPTLTAVTGLTRTVYNLTGWTIGGSNWVLVTRDKWGSWLVTNPFPFSGTGGIGPGTGTGTGTVGLHGHNQIINVYDQFIFNSQVTFLGPTNYYGGIVYIDNVTFNSSVLVSADICFDHYPLWDAFRDTLHTSPVADYAGSVKPWWRLNFDGSDPEWELSGIVAPPETCEGAEHVITNMAAVPLVLLPDDAGSVAANRFETPDGFGFYLATDESAWVRYDRILSRWRVLYKQGLAVAYPTISVTGIPDYTSVGVLIFDTVPGFSFSQPAPGRVLVTQSAADYSHNGYVSAASAGPQTFGGRKQFVSGISIGRDFGNDWISFYSDASFGGLALVGRITYSTAGMNLSGGVLFDGGSAITPAVISAIDDTAGTLKVGVYSTGAATGTQTCGMKFTAGLLTGLGPVGLTGWQPSSPGATFLRQVSAVEGVLTGVNSDTLHGADVSPALDILGGISGTVP